MLAREINFDGIVGPTHNFSGLSYGNKASTAHSHQVSNPRAAALQGLEKMRYVSRLGIRQAVLPPLRRPRIDVLRDLGFSGSDSEVINKAWKVDRALVAACFSASNMWTANAATVSPSSDCLDGKVHVTPANLSSALHRSIEAVETTQVLRSIFANGNHFTVHDPLPANASLSDEGAANHTRLCPEYSSRGLELFVYGRAAFDDTRPCPEKFPARQTLEACQAIARRHQLEDDAVHMIQQQPAAIDAGVFHNDVISVGNRNVLLLHELAFVDSVKVIDDLKRRYEESFGQPLYVIEFSSTELSIEDAIKSYLFNSQLLSSDDGSMTLVCPAECQQNAAAFACTQRMIQEDGPIENVEFLDLRQSMNNGGGPACLRLRVVLTEQECLSMHQGVLFDDALDSELTDWVTRSYREELAADDLRDPVLLREIDTAFEGLARILRLPSSLFGL